jgi:fructose-bisphosphate aldolase class I
MGARFAKWRAVITVGDGRPSTGCIEANAHALPRYAALCQEAGLVPVVEPEVVMNGRHTLARCGEVTQEVLRRVFKQLYRQWVVLEGMLVKPNMVLAGSACPEQGTVADATVHWCTACCDPSPPRLRGSHSCPEASPLNWPPPG